MSLTINQLIENAQQAAIAPDGTQRGGLPVLVGVGDPPHFIPVESAFRLETGGFVIIGNFEPIESMTFVCRTCRGAVTRGLPNECPACGGAGRQKLADYKRW